MAARFSKWAPFPYDAKAYAYAGDALKKAWPALHAGDQEPYPDEKRAKALIAAAGKAAKGMTADDLAQRLQDAWRAFHRGDFKAAFDAANVDLDKPLITTCGSGMTATVVAFGAHLLGKDDVAVYDGSWLEWGADAATPKATGAA